MCPPCGRRRDIGDADAFGHRHKANIGEALATELRARTGIETLASELTYDLRSGEPDSYGPVEIGVSAYDRNAPASSPSPAASASAAPAKDKK